MRVSKHTTIQLNLLCSIRNKNTRNFNFLIPVRRISIHSLVTTISLSFVLIELIIRKRRKSRSVGWRNSRGIRQGEFVGKRTILHSADRIDIIRADKVESDFSSGPRETSPVNPRRSVVETKPEIASRWCLFPGSSLTLVSGAGEGWKFEKRLERMDKKKIREGEKSLLGSDFRVR